MSQPSSYAQIKLDDTISTRTILSLPNNADTGYAIGVDLKIS